MHARQPVAVAQLGARMHYAVARILHREGLLARLFTDAVAAGPLFRWLDSLPASLLPSALRRFRGRRVPGVPSASITAFTSFGFRYWLRLAAASSLADRDLAYLWAGTEFCRSVLKHGLGDAASVYAMNTAAFELFRGARSDGRRCLLEQTIAPAAVEKRLLDDERRRWPGWEEAGRGFASRIAIRESAEWDLADLIVCGSDFVVTGIRESGGPSEKCVVVPYGVAGDDGQAMEREAPAGRRLRVLTVGAVGLRKGAPWILEAARRLGRLAEFRAVGPVAVSRDAAAKLASAVELTGQVPRAEVARHFAWADVFFLPSVCEGSATAIYEALRAGLPVVCTPNAGAPAREDGGVVEVTAGDADAMASALERLASDPRAWLRQAGAARAAAPHLSLESYGRRLVKCLGPLAAPCGVRIQ